MIGSSRRLEYGLGTVHTFIIGRFLVFLPPPPPPLLTAAASSSFAFRKSKPATLLLFLSPNRFTNHLGGASHAFPPNAGHTLVKKWYKWPENIPRTWGQAALMFCWDKQSMAIIQKGSCQEVIMNPNWNGMMSIGLKWLLTYNVAAIIAWAWKGNPNK